jgi:hypothetical protein
MNTAAEQRTTRLDVHAHMPEPRPAEMDAPHNVVTGYRIGDPDLVGFLEWSPSLGADETAAVLGGTLANPVGLRAAPTGLGVVTNG